MEKKRSLRKNMENKVFLFFNHVLNLWMFGKRGSNHVENTESSKKWKQRCKNMENTGFVKKGPITAWNISHTSLPQLAVTSNWPSWIRFLLVYIVYYDV